MRLFSSCNMKYVVWRKCVKSTKQIFNNTPFFIHTFPKESLQTETKKLFDKTRSRPTTKSNVAFGDKKYSGIPTESNKWVEKYKENEKKQETGKGREDEREEEKEKEINEAREKGQEIDSLDNNSLTPHWINLKGISGEIAEKNEVVVEDNDFFSVTNKQTEKEKWKCEEYLNISKKSKMMKYIIRLKRKRNFRNKMNAFFVKNAQTILHLLNNSNLTFEAVLSTNKNILQNFQDKCNKLYYVSFEIMNYIFKDSFIIKNKKNDAVAIVKIPNVVHNVKKIKFLLAFDRIRYAYNLGKILKVASAMDVDYLFYIHNTVDPFNSKVIEETNGEHLSIPYSVGSYEDLKQICIENNLLSLVAHTDGSTPDQILKENRREGICLIMSNESTGPHPSLLHFSKPISLPMHEMTNSLNVAVAASILIYILRSSE